MRDYLELDGNIVQGDGPDIGPQAIFLYCIHGRGMSSWAVLDCEINIRGNARTLRGIAQANPIRISPSSHPNDFLIQTRWITRKPTIISANMPKAPASAGVRSDSSSSGTPQAVRVMLVDAAAVSHIPSMALMESLTQRWFRHALHIVARDGARHDWGATGACWICRRAGGRFQRR